MSRNHKSIARSPRGPLAPRARVSLALVTYLSCASLATVAACGGKSEPPADSTETPESVKARVKFKGNDRLRNDFARALSLDADKMCEELGKHSCTHEVHHVALGGPAPYSQGLFEPLPFSTGTSPIAVERVALTACIARADRDLGGEGVIFANLDIASGKLADVESASVATAIDSLYKRAVQRPASETEIAHLRQLYRDVEADGSAQPARDWAVLTCFAVMTTMEQLFY